MLDKWHQLHEKFHDNELLRKCSRSGTTSSYILPRFILTIMHVEYYTKWRFSALFLIRADERKDAS